MMQKGDDGRTHTIFNHKFFPFLSTFFELIRYRSSLNLLVKTARRISLEGKRMSVQALTGDELNLYR